MFRISKILFICLIGLGGASAFPEEIPLSASLDALDVPGVAPLYVSGNNQELDEGNAGLGLSFVPFTNGVPTPCDWVYSPGINPEFQIESPLVPRVVLTVWNWFGQPVAIRGISPGTRQAVRFNISGNGTWLVTLDAYENQSADSLKSRLIRSFSVFPDCSGKRELWRTRNRYALGSCFFPYRYYRWKGWDYPDLAPGEVVDKLASMSARIGLSMLRIDYFPDAAGEDRTALAETVRLLGRHQIGIDWKIDLKPTVFIGDTLEFDSSRLRNFERNIDALASNYWNQRNARDGMVELGNEPAHHEFWAGSREQYVHLFRYLYDKIRAVNPDIEIVHGGACSPGADSWQLKTKGPKTFKKKASIQKVFYERLFRDIASKSTAWPYHFHGELGDGTQIEWLDGMRSAIRESGLPLTLFQTEGGACAWRPDFESSTWISVMQKFFYSWASGDKGWLQYSLASQPVAVRTCGGNEGWGLVQSSCFAPRFQYGAWAAVADWFAGCRFERSLVAQEPGRPQRFVYLFDHPEGKMGVCYSLDAEPVEMRVLSDSEEVLLIDPMGNAVPADGGNLRIVLKKYPQYILLKKASRVEVSFP